MNRLAKARLLQNKTNKQTKGNLPSGCQKRHDRRSPHRYSLRYPFTSLTETTYPHIGRKVRPNRSDTSPKASTETRTHVWGIRVNLPNADGEASPKLEWRIPRDTNLCLMRDRTLSIDPRAVEDRGSGRAFHQIPLRLLEASAHNINLCL